ncbi:terpenoid synthase [Pholiota conissans]|uniref:Terpenoid synthase n=1 Tax=Pholiota conissans TaxID=109636 RepID=A0A9P5Z450_9AGAR|nr:terpenoid synthase [Pholiota conissans]
MATSTLSTVVDTKCIPAYFSCLPVRIHNDTKAIDAATWDAINICAAVGTKERSQAAYRHTNPYGSPYAVCHPECNIRKLEYFVKVVEMIWIDDDVTEELPHAEALEEHEILRQGLHPEFDNDTNTGKTVGVKKAYLRAQRDGMLALDPVGTPGVLAVLDRYLYEYDRSDEDYLTLETYLPYRIHNAGYYVCARFTRWAMGIEITEEESKVVEEFERILGSVLALTNDYFSWRKEKLQYTDRVRNAVPILMRQYNIPEPQARLLLKGFIVEEEEKAKRIRMKLESRPDLSVDFVRYLDMLELYCGGNCYWSATCPRYNKPQEEEAAVVPKESAPPVEKHAEVKVVRDIPEAKTKAEIVVEPIIETVVQAHN